MADKVPVLMVLKVDLQCPCCYKKIKKVLCKFPQITGQIYDQNQNTVTISVVCCSPEKFRDKLRCKCGKLIQRIDIITQLPKPKEPEKKKTPPPEEGKPPVVVDTPIDVPKPDDKPQAPPSVPPEKKPKPVPVNPQPIYPPARTCCGPCSEGYVGGPCYHWYPAPPPCYDGYYGYGHGCGCGCGCGRGCNLRRSICYVEDENPSSCKIM